MQKTIFIICDGMPDRPLKQLKNQTPLEVAKTPNLDAIAKDGISGLMHTIDIGVRPGSDTAHLSIFGYDPYTYYSGRGPYECAGIGMDVRPGDVAFRANAATVDSKGIVTDRRAGRIASTHDIVKALGTVKIKGAEFILKSSLGHRIGLVVRGKNLSPKISDQDPHQTGVKILTVQPLDSSPAAKNTAKLMNEFTALALKKLKNTPFNADRIKHGLPAANSILFRGAGAISKNMLSFQDKYGLKAAFIAGAPMYKGIAKILGMDVIVFDDTDKVTGLPDSNVAAKIKKAIALTKTHDMVFVHIKAADSLAEDGNFKGKIAFIEKIDAALRPLAQSDQYLTVITSDHTTSSQLMKHTADPVPVTIKGEGVRSDDIERYTERECARGRLGHVRGENIMPIIIDLMGLAQLFGA